MSLRESWLSIHKKVSSLTDIPSGMNCIAKCNASCCPRKAEVGLIGKFVIFLPFELDNIKQALPERIVPAKSFKSQVLTREKDVEIRVEWTEDCPFLNDYKCSIYSYRPLDCKTFPLLAYHTSNNQITFEINRQCPENSKLRHEFIHYVQTLWSMYRDYLPEEWWQFLYSLDEPAKDSEK